MSDNFVNRNPDNAGIRDIIAFDGIGDNRYLESAMTGYAYVFFTKPQLFIYPYPNGADAYSKLAYDNMERDPFFSQFINGEALNASDRLLVKMLSYYPGYQSMDEYYRKTNFLPILTNRVRNHDTQDVTMEQGESFDTKQGFKMILPTFKTISEAGNSLSFDFVETSNMDITKLMGIWVNYISNITDGTFSANPRMIKGGMLDYMSSIYYFLLQPDGKTIKYWCKYTGCWPTNIPYSLSKFSKGSIDIAEGSITFVYMSKEDMNPDILKDFNKVSLNIDYDLPDTSEGDYSPTRKSSFLTKKGLENAGFALSDSRDPLIFLNDRSKLSGAASGRLSDCYELSFGADSVRNSLFDYNMFGDTGITSIDDYARSEMDDGESGN